jgi:hypothetical protein
MILLWSEAVDVEAESEPRFSLLFLRGAGMDSRQPPKMIRDSAEAARSRQTNKHHTDLVQLLAFSQHTPHEWPFFGRCEEKEESVMRSTNILYVTMWLCRRLLPLSPVLRAAY